VRLDQLFRLLLEEALEQYFRKCDLIRVFPSLLQLLNDVLDEAGALGILSAEETLKERFRPHYTVNDLFWFLANRAHWEALFLRLVDTLVTWSHVLFYRSAVALIAIRASFHERDAEVETKHVHVVARLNIVESVDHDVKLAKERETKAVFLDAANVIFDLEEGVLLAD